MRNECPARWFRRSIPTLPRFPRPCEQRGVPVRASFLSSFFVRRLLRQSPATLRRAPCSVAFFETGRGGREGNGAKMASVSRLQNSGDRRELPAPLLGFSFELLTAGFSQAVVFGPAIILSCPPLRLNPSGTLETAERGKEGTGIHLKNAFADLLDAHGNPITVHRFQRQRFQDQHVQRPLHQIGCFVCHQASPLGYRGESLRLYSRLSRGEAHWLRRMSLDLVSRLAIRD